MFNYAPEGYKMARPLCPECGAEQVQLLTLRVTPAPYRCRRCKHYFNVELVKIHDQGENDCDSSSPQTHL